MNVTLRLPDELCKAARHRAVDVEKSLSAYVVGLLEKDLENPKEDTARPKSWAELLDHEDFDDAFYEADFPLEDRKAGKVREFSFYD